MGRRYNMSSDINSILYYNIIILRNLHNIYILYIIAGTTHLQLESTWPYYNAQIII